MADLFQHIRQAEHNLDSAEEFLSLDHFWDWAITAAFYSAIHYAEAAFTRYPREDPTFPTLDSQHDRRQRLVKDRFGKLCWTNYRKLREASQNVRYLENKNRTSTTGTSLGYYSRDDAGDLIDLVPVIRSEMEARADVKLS